MNHLVHTLKNSINFKGRASRKEYWIFALFSLCVGVILGLTSGTDESGFFANLNVVGWIILALFSLAGIAVAVRRMHDIGKSGWYSLIPFYSFYLTLLKSDGKNDYGDKAVDIKEETSFRVYFSESVGTFLLTSVLLIATRLAIGGSQLAARDPRTGGVFFDQVYLISVPMLLAATFGLVTLMISKISGAHVNPAITVANWSMKKIKSVTALGYIVAQFAGAYLALAVMNMFNSDLGQSAVTSADLWPIFAAEALGAFVLAFGWAASSSKKNKMTDLEKGVLVGGSLFLGITLASFVTGAGNLNPAIVWATSTWDVQLTKVLPALVLGPVLGAAIGMNLYAFLNDEVKFESKKTLDKLKNSGEYIKNRFSKVSEDN